MVSRSRMTRLAPVSVSIRTKRETRPGLDRDRPPAPVGRQRGRAHGRADHALLAHLDRAEIGELCLGEVIEIDPPRAGAGGEIDEASVRRRIDRPFGDVGTVRRLHEFARCAVLEENLRRAGPMRNEDQPSACRGRRPARRRTDDDECSDGSVICRTRRPDAESKHTTFRRKPASPSRRRLSGCLRAR